MTMPRHIQDQISAYRAHMQKASDHLSKANYEAKKLLMERGIEVNAQDHDYLWTILGEKCPESPIGVCCKDLYEAEDSHHDVGDRPVCIFCGK